MGKVPRYFTPQENSEPNTNSDKNDFVTYDVDIKKTHPKKKKFKLGDKKLKAIIKKIPNPNPKFKGRVPIPQELLNKYGKGEGVDNKSIKTKTHQKKIERKEENIKFATEQAARTEILLTEQSGCLEADEGETTTQFTQKQIASNVDITAAAKHFDLKLQFGPYRAKYTRNGRHLILGGKKGHVAAFDWVTKKLHCELNVMESVHDVCWLHIETMFAVAQKNWVYIYDNQGIELHCIKRLNKVSRMEFLPYHFLLASCSDEGYLSWLDISIGKLVSQYNSKLGRLSVMSQNPWNAVLCVGHAKGVVSMWSPNVRDPLAKMLCHTSPILALHVDPKGRYMATSDSNRELKIWDIRQLSGPVQRYRLRSSATNLAFSQTDMLAVGMGNIVEVYKHYTSAISRRAYLRNRFNTPIGNFSFCPYEDVLGVTTDRGFTSMLVPGSGEANFDALEANPFQTKSQRREAEVKALLEKIQPELITLDPTIISEVNVPSLKEKVEAKQKLLFIKPPTIDYEPRNKAKGKGGSAKMARNRKIVKEQAKKEFIKETQDFVPKLSKSSKKTTDNILDRFLTVKQK
ncbi:hypothetical protein HHI36_017866 [Cryptolaemus montrouzieri]|uniref:BING4 C-terminal domain-containing protein n=1 Tax=Cryptolaemus montrouzieri TaxID=559131 RepID=A0ABD2NNW8_9CUCU